MSAVCITLGEQSENHFGMIKYGDGLAQKGYSVDDLKLIKKNFEELGGVAEMIRLDEHVPLIEKLNVEPAGILILRGGVDLFLGDENKDENKDNVWKELMSFEWDKKYWDTRRSKVLNKIARYNVCFGKESVRANYEEKKGSVISYDSVPVLKKWKEKVEEFLGEENGFEAEGNYYYDTKKCGIGFHGDSERKKIVAASFGETRELVWCWYHQSKRISEKIRVVLNDGDMYLMSEKASGWDWKKRSIRTIRHAAGAEKYLK